MKTTHSFATDFLIRLSKENKKKALIYARITVDEERREISLKEQIDASEWNKEKEMLTGKTERTKSINQFIEDVRFKIKEKYRQLCDKDALITAEIVKQAYLGNHLQLKGHKLTELMKFYCDIWKEKLQPGTYKNMGATVKYVTRYLTRDYPDGDIFLSQLDIEFITRLEDYIRKNPIKAEDPCKGNGVAKNIERFKRMIAWAKEMKWISDHPVQYYRCPKTKPKRLKLNIQQLVTVEQQDFADPVISYVKDLYLHSCYAGFAYAEAMELRDSHFEWDMEGTIWCKIYRKKSDELCAIPILKSAAKILTKYRNRPDYQEGGYIFPRIANTTVNDALKIIQAVCGIEFPMTFHTARHTFAKTVALANKIPITSVQIMMGHTKISTTMIYAEVDEDIILDDTAGWQEKLDKKRESAMASRKLQVRVNGILQWTD